MDDICAYIAETLLEPGTAQELLKVLDNSGAIVLQKKVLWFFQQVGVVPGSMQNAVNKDLVVYDAIKGYIRVNDDHSKTEFVKRSIMQRYTRMGIALQVV